ncbi:MAG: hypothetical protein ACTSU5_00705 [Promethearchaeota archaeon]
MPPLRMIVNLASHFLTGILCQVLVQLLLPAAWWTSVVVAVVAFLSHFLVDAVFERVTYHPKPWLEESKTRFARYKEVPMVVLAAALAFLYSRYWVGLLFSVGVDLYDWVLLRALLKKDFREDNHLFLHRWCDRLQEKLMSWAPDLNEDRRGFAVELAYIAFTLAAVVLWA